MINENKFCKDIMRWGFKFLNDNIDQMIEMVDKYNRAGNIPIYHERIFNRGFVPINPSTRYGFEYNIFQSLILKGYKDLHHHKRIEEISIKYSGKLPINYML